MVDNATRSAVTPSMMTKGSLLPVSDVVPRTRTAETMASWLPPFVTCTPATCPFRTSIDDFTSVFVLRIFAGDVFGSTFAGTGTM